MGACVPCAASTAAAIRAITVSSPVRAMSTSWSSRRRSWEVDRATCSESSTSRILSPRAVGGAGGGATGGAADTRGKSSGVVRVVLVVGGVVLLLGLLLLATRLLLRK